MSKCIGSYCVIVIAVLTLVGCHTTQKGIEVTIQGDGKFSPELVGTWQAETDYWRFVFEPDGSISSAIVNIGATPMEPGKTAEFTGRKGSKGIYKPGIWKVNYNPEFRDLTVEIVLDHFYQQMDKSGIEGNHTDILQGTVSEDGTTWEPDWYSQGTMTAILSSGRNTFYDIKEPEYRRALIFRKIEESQPAP